MWYYRALGLSEASYPSSKGALIPRTYNLLAFASGAAGITGLYYQAWLALEKEMQQQRFSNQNGTVPRAGIIG